LIRAILIAFQASKRSKVDLFKYDFRSAWIPSTREVAVLPKWVDWSTQALTSFSLNGRSHVVLM
jgi:hypothetical protein